MDASNKLGQTVLIILVIVLLLLMLSLTDSSFTLGNYRSKRVDIISDIKTNGLFKGSPVSNRLLTDSVIRADSSSNVIIKADPAAIIDFGSDSIPALAYFCESLFKTQQKQKKTRIAYFGDSMIEGDLVTQDLRSTLQDTFGGIGVGFMPITSIVAGFRQTIFHTFSKDWQTYTLLDQNASNHTLGIAGFDFVPTITANTDTSKNANGSWVKYGAVAKKHLNKFYNARLFYGPGTDNSNVVTAAGQTFPLNGTSTVNELRLLKSYPVQSLQATFHCREHVNVFGFSLDADSGVYVDNFSFRGNSGMPLTKIHVNVLSGLNAHLDYGLIILHYGVNVVNQKVTDFSWYERGMTEVVNHLKAAMPKTSILVISAGDKSVRQDGEYVTDPSVPLVIEVQKRVAQKTGVAFWNLYEAMGGYNAMVKWVQGDTVLANKDYTHPNSKGAKKIADLLYKHLIIEYKEYVKKKT